MFVFIDLFCSLFFFFKQKTAYEMRISDWSSDVCSSDLFRFQCAELGTPKKAKCLGRVATESLLQHAPMLRLHLRQARLEGFKAVRCRKLVLYQFQLRRRIARHEQASRSGGTRLGAERGQHACPIERGNTPGPHGRPPRAMVPFGKAE